MVTLTPKQEIFVQGLLDPETSQVDAYKKAYDVNPETAVDTVHEMASRLSSNHKIKLRIDELKAEAYSNSPFTTDVLRSRIQLRGDKADDLGQMSTAIRALELIGKLDGLIVDRKEITGSMVIATIELSTDELRQLVTNSLAIEAEYQLKASTDD